MTEILVSKLRYEKDKLVVAKGKVEVAKLDYAPHVVAEPRHGKAEVTAVNQTELNPGRTNLVLFYLVACWAKEYGHPEISGDNDILEIQEPWLLSKGFTLSGSKFQVKTGDFFETSGDQLGQWRIKITQ